MLEKVLEKIKYFSKKPMKLFLAFISVVCVGCVIVSFGIFVIAQNKDSEELSQASDLISQYAKEEKAYTEKKKAVLVSATAKQNETPSVDNANTDSGEGSENDSNAKGESEDQIDTAETEQSGIEQSIDYLERLQKVKEDSASNNIMSFLITMLSSFLVALCASFVAKSYDNLQETKKNAEKVERTCEEATKNADIASKFAKTAKEANKSALLAAEKAEESKTQYEKSKEEQQFFSKILEILIAISDARTALRFNNKIEATDRITEIEILTLDLSDVKQSYLIKQLLEELLRLESSVVEYEAYVAKSDISQARKDSAFTAVERYKNQIKSAIDYCDKLIEEAESAETV